MLTLSAYGFIAAVESYLKNDRYLHQHYRWYTREMRILAYGQLLESYRSITLASMAQSFGVSQEYIDQYVYIYLNIQPIQNQLFKTK